MKKILVLVLVLTGLHNVHAPSVQAAQNATSEKKPLEMTLHDAVSLALRQNRNIRIFYLDRVLDKYNLQLAQSTFIPNVRLDGTANIKRDDQRTEFDFRTDGRRVTDTLSTSVSPSVTQTIPTGGELAFVWDNSRGLTRIDDNNGEDNDHGFTSTWAVSFTQPLLKGGGVTVTRAPVIRAEIQEQENILVLRDNLSSIVASAVNGYLNFYQASRNLRIRKMALERAREQLEINNALIDAGRMAPSEIVQSEAQVADQEFAYQSAFNTLDNARLSLLDVLEMDLNTQIRAVDDISMKMITPDLEKSLEIARNNNTTLVVAKNRVTIAELGLIEEKNSRLWQLDLQASYGQELFNSFGTGTDDRTRDFWGVGLSLDAPFEIFGRDYLTEKIGLLRARRDLRVSKINLKEQMSDLNTRVINAVRNVNTQLTLVQQARRRRELAEQKLEIEKVKLRLGRTTNFQVVSFENDLVNAQESEIQSTIAYLNALTDLDVLLGTALDTWNVEFKTQSADAQDALGSEGYFYGREP